jgi:hypothetical protein
MSSEQATGQGDRREKTGAAAFFLDFDGADIIPPWLKIHLHSTSLFACILQAIWKLP